jgi:hypothetical protein
VGRAEEGKKWGLGVAGRVDGCGEELVHLGGVAQEEGAVRGAGA